MNYYSKFNGISSDFLLILATLKDKARKFPALNRDLVDLQAFHDTAAGLFAEADAALVTKQVEIILLKCEKKDTEQTITHLLKSLMDVDPTNAEKLI